jgi:cation transport regulator
MGAYYHFLTKYLNYCPVNLVHFPGWEVNVMPYSKTSDLPDSVRKVLPKHAEDIYKEAFNHALEEYEGDESRAYAVAWSAVKKRYKKNEKSGKWEEIESH